MAVLIKAEDHFRLKTWKTFGFVLYVKNKVEKKKFDVILTF